MAWIVVPTRSDCNVSREAVAPTWLFQPIAGAVLRSLVRPEHVLKSHLALVRGRLLHLTRGSPANAALLGIRWSRLRRRRVPHRQTLSADARGLPLVRGTRKALRPSRLPQRHRHLGVLERGTCADDRETLWARHGDRNTGSLLRWHCLGS